MVTTKLKSSEDINMTVDNFVHNHCQASYLPMFSKELPSNTADHINYTRLPINQCTKEDLIKKTRQYRLTIKFNWSVSKQ